MKYGNFELAEAEGIVLAHTIRSAGRRVGKGEVLTVETIRELSDQGVSSVVGVRLDEGDLGEDEAAGRIAGAIDRDHLRVSDAATGRVNIHAAADGLFLADKGAVDELNLVDPAITLACLADHVPVRAGAMVATIKIIPLAVPAVLVEKAEDILKRRPAFAVKPYSPRSVILIATELPSLKSSVMDRTAKVLTQRLAVFGSRLIKEIRVPHDREAVSEALQALDSDDFHEPAMVVVFGASAVADFDDVIPAAIRHAGGHVDHIGMPVDPGNLLVLGRLGNMPVIGAPGCARSPRENGFDWVLNRIMAGEMPTSKDIAGMGVGGLLMEIPSRPRPREAVAQQVRPIAVGSLLLAAGQARRMGANGPHKLLAEFEGMPLVRRSAKILLDSDLTSVAVVTGHRRADVGDALSGLDLTLQYNPDYSTGMASSLIAGFSRPEFSLLDGILVMLADMPAVTSEHVNMLVARFRESGGRAIIRSVFEGKRGNPIILPRDTYPAVLRLEGDIGARAIIESSGLPVIDVEIGPAAHIDVDTPQAVLAAGGILKS